MKREDLGTSAPEHQQPPQLLTAATVSPTSVGWKLTDFWKPPKGKLSLCSNVLAPSPYRRPTVPKHPRTRRDLNPGISTRRADRDPVGQTGSQRRKAEELLSCFSLSSFIEERKVLIIAWDYDKWVQLTGDNSIISFSSPWTLLEIEGPGDLHMMPSLRRNPEDGDWYLPGPWVIFQYRQNCAVNIKASAQNGRGPIRAKLVTSCRLWGLGFRIC